MSSIQINTFLWFTLHVASHFSSMVNAVKSYVQESILELYSDFPKEAVMLLAESKRQTNTILFGQKCMLPSQCGMQC